MDPQHSTPKPRQSEGFLKKKRVDQLLTPDPSPVPGDAYRQHPRAIAPQKDTSHLPTPTSSESSDLDQDELNWHPAQGVENHTLQDLNMQLMLLEQQNGKRLLLSQPNRQQQLQLSMQQTRLAQAIAQLQQQHAQLQAQQQQAQLQAKVAVAGLCGSGVKTATMDSSFLPTPPTSAQSTPQRQDNATITEVWQPALQQQTIQQQVTQQLLCQQQMAQYQAAQQQAALQRMHLQFQQEALQRHRQQMVAFAVQQQIAQHRARQQQQNYLPGPGVHIPSMYLQNRNQQFIGMSQELPPGLSNLPSHGNQYPRIKRLPDPVGNNVFQPANMTPTGMLPLSPKAESPGPEVLHSHQDSIYDMEDASENKSMSHSTQDEVIVRSEGAKAPLSEQGSPTSATHPQDQSQTQSSPDPKHERAESPPESANDVSSRNNSLSSFTEDDTDWGEDENTNSYDFQFADFSAVSEASSSSRDKIKVGLTRPVFSPLKQGIVDRIMKEFWSLWDGEGGIFRNDTNVSPLAVFVELKDDPIANGVKSHEGGEGSSRNTHSTAIASTASPDQRPTSNLKRRGREDEDDHEQNGRDDRSPKRPRKSLSSPKTPHNSTKFACPYRKRDPRKYCVQNWRSCALTPLDNVARVKAHLYRHHRIFPCRRCKKLFKDQAAVNSHLEQSEGCELRAVEIADGVTADIVDKLRNKKTGQRTEVQRWEDIYRLLFPNEVVPSPYFEDIQEDLALSPDSRDLADYEEYCRRELPLLFRAALEERVQNDSQPIEENIRNQLMDIIRDCQDRVSSRYRSSTATAAGTPWRNPTRSRSPTIKQESRTNISMNANPTPQPDIAPFFQPPPPQSHLQSRLEVSDLQDNASKPPDSSDPSDSGYGSNESGISSGISSSFNNSSDDLSLPSSQPQIASEPDPPQRHGLWDMDNEFPDMSSSNDFMNLAETNTFDSSFDCSWEYGYQSTYENTWDPDMGGMNTETEFSSGDSL